MPSLLSLRWYTILALQYFTENKANYKSKSENPLIPPHHASIADIFKIMLK